MSKVKLEACSRHIVQELQREEYDEGNYKPDLSYTQELLVEKMDRYAEEWEEVAPKNCR